ncbi:flavin-containing monooxygenase [Naasia aerilata]|uniref:Flavin-binding monooxygenase n=1 Tax=Naasia aerilata TaxID=1162966 RepID=A0ABM8G8D1_9MICO|nr:NAD(P)/FAD-dependent oxidoreductase [Naasia aerilata]BDZ44439.1 flavin-binding monooxygenase [Naasia aerilata]
MDHVDVLIVGAGISGIGAACHLVRECPDRTFAIIESRDAVGGTWDLFRYPGIRSDSDMFTFGYEFEPWREPKTIADGSSIRAYLADTVRKYGIESRIRFGTRVQRAEWSSADARWTVTVRRGDAGEETQLTCSFLSVCTGYYRYDEGYTPDYPGRDDFAGTVVHPQLWPEDLDCAGKQVVIIGSGATAVTLVPTLAREAAKVTMLQRSPTYIASRPSRDRFADRMRQSLPARIAYPIVRWKNVLYSIVTYTLSRKAPSIVKSALRRDQVRTLPAGYDIARHLTPSYEPWDQRLCVAPDGDLFAAIRAGRAEIVTDHIERFTPHGILLRSGEELPADVVVSATGLKLLPIGGIELVVDGSTVDVARTIAYKGMMLSGVPNFALTIGYTNASWTLKADLVARYVCRLLNRMKRTGEDSVTPVAPPLDPSTLEPLIDFSSGYVRRSVDLLPKQGPAAPWRLHQNYLKDVQLMRRGPLTDGVRFGRSADALRPTAEATAR